MYHSPHLPVTSIADRQSRRDGRRDDRSRDVLLELHPPRLPVAEAGKWRADQAGLVGCVIGHTEALHPAGH